MSSVLLLACYELGHPPLSVAWPLTRLRQAGIDATAVDLAVDRFPIGAARRATFVGVAVPMHTALRLGVEAARRVRRHNPNAHICFYGLYAQLNAGYLLNEKLADSLIAGEYDEPLQALIVAHQRGDDLTGVPGVSLPDRPAAPHLARIDFPVPDRTQLPPLDQYARLAVNGDYRLAGYVEASRGCLHTCTHCPVVPIYGGRFFVVPRDVVLADIEQQVRAGARHITFGDPDFLNGPGHALAITRELHARFPEVTFDFTTKVEHLLEKRELLPELRKYGALFVISAFESVSERVLERLEKGHTVADMEAALRLLRAAGLEVQPTWVPFTPWTTLEDYLALLAWIREQELVAHVPVVQLAVRLLIPPGSALLRQPDAEAWCGELDAANFTYRWAHSDPRVDGLHEQVSRLAEQHAGDEPYTAFAAVERAAYGMANRPVPEITTPVMPHLPPPRLTEDWFC